MIDLDNISSREDMLKIIQPNGNGIEIGVSKGEFSLIILENCPNLNLYLLDCWDTQPTEIYEDDPKYQNIGVQIHNFSETIKRISPHFRRVNIIKAYSEEFADLFPDNSFDFIYIDANHSYEAVKFDINKWYPKLRIEGLFAGHDYVDIYENKKQKFGVKQAVDEFGKENDLKIHHTKEKVWKTWFTFKNK
jgi:hypothetical protein